MAGRGRRLGGYGEKDGPMRRPGELVIQTNTENISFKALMDKINRISAANVDPILMYEIEILFKQLCITGESVKDVLLNLYCKALSDSGFGLNLAIALEPIINFEVDGTDVRSELLNLIEKDYKKKDTMCHSDPRKFMNAAMFLGGVYNVIKIHQVPISVLGTALLEYIDLLLKGEEEQLRVVTVQILLNGNYLTAVETTKRMYELLKYSLRKTLIQRNLSTKSKCWILLALDYMSNNLKPLSGTIRDFYLGSIGDDYSHWESIITNSNPSKSAINQSQSPGSLKYQLLQPINTETVVQKENKNEDLFQDIETLNIQENTISGKNPVGKGLCGGYNPNRNELRVSRTRRYRVDDPKLKEKKSFDISQVDENEWYGIQIEKEKFDRSSRKTISDQNKQ